MCGCVDNSVARHRCVFPVGLFFSNFLVFFARVEYCVVSPVVFKMVFAEESGTLTIVTVRRALRIFESANFHPDGN